MNKSTKSVFVEANASFPCCKIPTYMRFVNIDIAIALVCKGCLIIATECSQITFFITRCETELENHFS